MKKTLLLLLFLAAVSRVLPQQGQAELAPRPEFIVSANLSSGVSLVSLGLEKLFFLKPNLALAARAELGYNQEFRIFSSGTPPVNYFFLPHHLTCNFGKKKSFLELGAGGAWVSGGGNDYYLVYPILGYRLHPFRNPGFSFRTWLYFPFGQDFITEDGEVIFAPVGLSFGIAM
jgi:hypothetical protein